MKHEPSFRQLQLPRVPTRPHFGNKYLTKLPKPAQGQSKRAVQSSSVGASDRAGAVKEVGAGRRGPGFLRFLRPGTWISQVSEAGDLDFSGF